jgi:hypothetical protein
MIIHVDTIFLIIENQTFYDIKIVQRSLKIIPSFRTSKTIQYYMTLQ